MKRLIFLIPLLSSICLNAEAQSIRPEISEIVSEIIESDSYKADQLPVKRRDFEKPSDFIRLNSSATTEELVLLTSHPNGVVRCYSFKALNSRDYPNIYTMILNHLHDTTEIRTIMGCLIEFQMVGDFFLESVDYKQRTRISAIQELEIDSILLFDRGIQLAAKADLLRTLKPEEKYYTRIREMVVLEKSNYALTTLSKYRKTADLPFIIEALKDKNIQNQRFGLIAAKNFPHDSLFPYLKEIYWAEVNNRYGGFDWEKLRFLYQALVQYDSQEAQQLIRQTSRADFKVTNLGYHHQYIWLALQLYPNEIYSEIPNKLVLSESEKERVRYWKENPDLF